MQAPAKSWWLLLLCGILEAIYCGMNFFMLRPDRTLALRTLVSRRSTVVDMGILALAAGLCVIAAAIRNSSKTSAWLLALNGVALSVLGLIFMFWTGPLSFRTIALLFAAMAISAGVYELAIAQASHHAASQRLWSGAGVISFAFALLFLADVFRLINLRHASAIQTFIWMGSYFGFSAICRWALAVRAADSPAIGSQNVLPLGNPKHAH